MSKEVVPPPQASMGFDYVNANKGLGRADWLALIPEYEKSFGKKVRQMFGMARAMRDDLRVCEFVVYDNCEELKPEALISALTLYYKSVNVRYVYVHHDKGKDAERPHWHIRAFFDSPVSMLVLASSVAGFSGCFIPPFMWAYPRKYMSRFPMDNYEYYVGYLTHSEIESKTTYLWSVLEGDKDLIEKAEKWANEYTAYQKGKKSKTDVSAELTALTRYLLELVEGGVYNPMTELTIYALNNGYHNTLKNYFNVLRTMVNENRDFAVVSEKRARAVEQYIEEKRKVREKKEQQFEQINISFY